MKRLRFVVGTNIPGFLPNTDPEEFDNEYDAFEHVKYLIKDYGFQVDTDEISEEFDQALAFINKGSNFEEVDIIDESPESNQEIIFIQIFKE